jgi:uncharacterized protein (TIGR02001 family)
MWALPPADPGFEISVATQGMSKGLLQSNGPQLVVRPNLELGSFQLGAQWKNISTNSAKGEASAIAGWNGKAGSLELGASIAYKALTSASGSGNRRSVEVSGNVSRKLGRVSLKGSAVYSPNDLGSTRQSLYAEVGPSIDLPEGFKLSANVGHRWRQRSPNYTSFNIGVSRPVLKALTADVRLYDTNRGELGRTYDRRVVGSLKLAL